MFGCIANYFIENNNNINKMDPKSKKKKKKKKKKGDLPRIPGNFKFIHCDGF